MSAIDKWMQDIMSQRFIDSDISKLIILEYFYKDNCLKKIYKKSDICTYLYRVYSDNEIAAHANPNYRIKNIHNYGVDDIKPILEKTLTNWMEYAPNGVLMHDSYFVYLNIENAELVDAAQMTKDVCELFKIKYFHFDCKEPSELDVQSLRNDSDIDIFGNSIFKNRVMEDMQYCQLCEKTGYKQLRVVHILPAKYCRDSELVDKNNGLIFCAEHAQDYIDGKFYFEENGFIHFLNTDKNTDGTHLSVKVKNPDRREYIKKYIELVKEER